jgi:Alw26I/Eco31I/Esp3I family type II restriction endonuclease
MAKQFHQNFKDYQQKFISSINDNDYPFERKSEKEISWYAMKDKPYGKKMLTWADNRIKQLGIEDKAGKYRMLMYEVHPFKEKPCAVCGETMSIDYIYINQNLVKKINKELALNVNTLTSIYELFENNKSIVNELTQILEFNPKKKIESEIDNLISECKVGKKTLGPGAMSNFPDRIDGYHTYNRCCRSKEDKGRHVDNLRSYSKDRRAYEFWSDGNLHAANRYMASKRFKNTSADHIGPISLGFKHESIFIQPMESGPNSSKGDRLVKKDIEKLIKIEADNELSPISFQAQILWKELKKTKLTKSNLELFRDYFKQNQIFFYFVLYQILNNENGLKFLVEFFIKPKMIYFNYDYEFNDEGKIIKKTPRKSNDANKKEFDRMVKVSTTSLIDFSKKSNRKVKVKYSKEIKLELDNILELVKIQNYPRAHMSFIKMLETYQKNLLN